MATAGQLYFPPSASGQWETVRPAEVGWHAKRLDDALSFAGGKHSTGLIVLRDGRILAERYWGTGGAHTVRDIASAQKSVVSVLVGIAQQQGLLSIDAPSSAVLGDGWSQAPADHERRITLRHHLSMCTGLDEELAPESEPGASWYYNNRAYHIVKDGLERVTGRPLDEWSREVLWGPIGMADTSWVTRQAPPGVPRNLFAFGPEDAPFSALLTTVRDMARFGLLVQNHGEWDGRPVLADRFYLDAATETSQQMNPSYGFFWWLNGKASYLRPMRQGRVAGPLVPSAPPDLFCALGAADQKIYVCRSLGLVVARQGAAAEEPGAAMSSFDDALWAKLMAARLE